MLLSKVKDKYEIILGFVTLVISFSAFKEELSQIVINLGYIDLKLSDYFLFCICGFTLCLYLYAMERMFQDTRFGSLKMFDWVIKGAYFLFILILITPLFLVANILIIKIISLIQVNKIIISSNIVNNVTSVVLALLTTLIAEFIFRKLVKERKKIEQEEIELQEIKELDNANKLFKDGYFSHSVLESFKVLESHIRKKLLQKNIRVQTNNFNEMLKLSRKENIIEEEDLPVIRDIRGMRNISAHLNAEHTKQQAEFALNFVKELLQRNNL